MSSRTTPDAYDRMKQDAILRAHQDRAEAIDAFWQNAGESGARALRAARRFAARLAHHTQLRRAQAK